LSTIPDGLVDDAEFCQELRLRLAKELDFTPGDTSSLSWDVERWIGYYLEGGHKPRPSRSPKHATVQRTVENVLMELLGDTSEKDIPPHVFERLTRPKGKHRQL